MWRKSVSREDNVRANGIRERTEIVCRFGGPFVGVDAHAAEVVSEKRLQCCAASRVERPRARVERTPNIGGAR
ncbi:MAG TPA: hypothetical protein VGQ65_12140 [Thermoanaerobaculia bacterium]|nr:hypothetical protein [Thermoanaerobaculia bacterium]